MSRYGLHIVRVHQAGPNYYIQGRHKIAPVSEWIISPVPDMTGYHRGDRGAITDITFDSEEEAYAALVAARMGART